MGSSEGNLYALWNAREYLEGLSVVGDDAPGTHDLGGMTVEVRVPSNG